jgi:hypothetical protein
MNILKVELENRFGKENVNEFYFKNTDNPELLAYPFIVIDIQMRSKIKVLMTNGLSTYKMPVLDKFIGKEHNELYFCLPSYWDLKDLNNPNVNWVFGALFRLQKHVQDKKSWFGVGHTIPFSNPLAEISEKMKEKYFFLDEPIFLKNELNSLKQNDKTIHFLAVIPIFEDELDYKLGKTTFKLQKKMQQQNVSELLDDYRCSVLKSKWRFWAK